MPYTQQEGFTLVELIAVLVLVGIIAGVSASRFMSNKTLQLQAGRDVVISALFVAQQKATAQGDSIRVITGAGSIDIRQDSNNDSSFGADESIRYAGTTYPISLPGEISITNHQLDYDRLGRTTATTITLSKSSKTVNVNISGTGYAY